MEKRDRLKKFVDRFSNKKNALIKILQEAQEVYSYLSDEVISTIADLTQIPPTEILGVASFYTQFRFHPVGKHIIRTCEGTACHVNGAKNIKNVIMDTLKIGEHEVTSDGFYSVEAVACIGCCSLAPVIMIDEETFGNLDAPGAIKALKDFKKAH